MAQRNEIAQELNDVISRAQTMLAQVGGATVAGYRKARAAAPAASGAVDGGGTAPTRKRKRFTMSAEARKRISEAQKARWAAKKADGGAKKARKA